MSKRLDQLMAAQEKVTQKRHDAQQEEKRLKKQISDLKGKERTHRLCTRGGYLEKLLQKPEAFTDEEVFTFLEYAFNTPFVRDRLKAFLEAKHSDPGGEKSSNLGSACETPCRAAFAALKH